MNMDCSCTKGQTRKWQYDFETTFLAWIESLILSRVLVVHPAKKKKKKLVIYQVQAHQVMTNIRRYLKYLTIDTFSLGIRRLHIYKIHTVACEPSKKISEVKNEIQTLLGLYPSEYILQVSEKWTKHLISHCCYFAGQKRT